MNFSPSTKEWTSYCSSLLHFLNSNPEYERLKKELFQCVTVTNAQHKLVFKFTLNAIKAVFAAKASEKDTQTSSLTSCDCPREFDELTQSKNRYIGGSCVVALRKRYE